MVVPSDWKEVRLGDNAIVAKGSQLSKILMIEHGKYPHLNGGISPSGYTEQFNAGPYVIAISEGGNSCGFVHFMKERFWSGGHCYTLQPKGIKKDFLYHALKGKQETIMGLRVGSGLPNVQKTALMNLVLIAPKDIEEQEAIAEALSDADSAIESLDALIAKKRDVKQGTMQQHAQAERVGPDARMVALGSVAVINKGELITSSTSGEGPHPVIAGGKSPAYFSSKFNRDGLTITISASGANAGYVALRKGKIWASDCSTISEDSSIDMYYLAAQLEVRQEKIYRAQFGGAQPHVRPNDLAPLEICYVPLVRQQEIGSALRAMDDELEALSEQASKLRMVKEGMMQDLLTGKVRLV